MRLQAEHGRKRLFTLLAPVPGRTAALGNGLRNSLLWQHNRGETSLLGGFAVPPPGRVLPRPRPAAPTGPATSRRLNWEFGALKISPGRVKEPLQIHLTPVLIPCRVHFFFYESGPSCL